MDHKLSTRYPIFFMPWMLALLFADYPALSYLLAWLGSFFIFYISLSGKVTPIPQDRNFGEQLMRPIILVQIIFAGYMCCTSIFYFLDVLGYAEFKLPDTHYLIDENRLLLTAQCQRYYCLAHASFVCGLLTVGSPKRRADYQYDHTELHKILLFITCGTLLLAYALRIVDGLQQFSHQLGSLSFIAGTLALASAIPERRTANIIFCFIIYTFNLYQAVLSGFKEPIILSILILGIYLYPHYRKTVVLTFLPLLLLLFILLPTYNRIFREQAWSADVAASRAGSLALEATLQTDIGDGDWSFLTYRLSEIDMFTKYLRSIQDSDDYYGFQLVRQALMSVIPRVLWPAKPETEQLVMRRVYHAGVVQEGSKVSAKPAFIVDAYLSAGAPGIVLFLFAYGTLCQYISNTTEKLFGGYTLGTALIFTGLFQIFWRGQSFEFLFNSVCWSFISMYLIFWTLRITHILNPT